MSDRGAIGMEPGKVVLVPYDPRWEDEFNKCRRELEQALGSSVLSIQHVGSTSVPGLDAKPIIDMLVGVPDLSGALDLVPVLESLGFEFRDSDELPDRHYFPRSVGGIRTHHVSVAEPGSRHFRNTLIFRDALRADAALAQRYSALKHRLADSVGTIRHAYVNGKTDFILSTLRERGGVVDGDYPFRDLGSAQSSP